MVPAKKQVSPVMDTIAFYPYSPARVYTQDSIIRLAGAEIAKWHAVFEEAAANVGKPFVTAWPYADTRDAPKRTFYIYWGASRKVKDIFVEAAGLPSTVELAVTYTTGTMTTTQGTAQSTEPNVTWVGHQSFTGRFSEGRAMTRFSLASVVSATGVRLVFQNNVPGTARSKNVLIAYLRRMFALELGSGDKPLVSYADGTFSDMSVELVHPLAREQVYVSGRQQRVDGVSTSKHAYRLRADYLSESEMAGVLSLFRRREPFLFRHQRVVDAGAGTDVEVHPDRIFPAMFRDMEITSQVSAPFRSAGYSVDFVVMEL